MLKIELIETEEELLALEGEWNAVLSRSLTNTFFQTFEWIRTWWEHFHQGRRLFTLVVKDDGRIIGIAPLMITVQGAGPLKLRTLQLIGTGALPFLGLGLADRMDLIIADRAEEALSCIFDFIFKQRSRWDVMDLLFIPAQSVTVEFIERLPQQYHCSVNKRLASRSPYVALGSSYEEYLRSRSRNFRKKLARSERLLSEHGDARFERHRGTESVAEVMNSVFAIAERSWKTEAASSLFQQKPIANFFKSLAETVGRRGWFDVSLIKLADQAVAYELCFSYNGRMLSYNCAYDSRYSNCSPGTLLTTFIIKNSIAEQLAEYDMLRGDEEYKLRFTDQLREEVQLVVYKKGLRSRIAYWLKFALKWRLHKSKVVWAIHDRLAKLFNR